MLKGRQYSISSKEDSKKAVPITNDQGMRSRIGSPDVNFEEVGTSNNPASKEEGTLRTIDLDESMEAPSLPNKRFQPILSLASKAQTKVEETSSLSIPHSSPMQIPKD